MTLFLEFNGGFSPNNGLGIDADIFTKAFSMDGDYNNVNATERDVILDAWAHVAEDYAPFNINVTTVHPGFGNLEYRLLVGDDGKERQSSPTSGWLGGNDDEDPVDGFVYTECSCFSTGGNYGAQIGTTASHESGHAFGLSHKGDYVWDLGGIKKTNTYSTGDSFFTPIMGSNLETDRTIWTQSIISTGPFTSISGDDDIGELTEKLGLRADDHPHAFWANTDIGDLNSPLITDGLIENTSDLDIFRFDVVQPGVVNLDLRAADIGGNLDATLQLIRFEGLVEELASDAPEAVTSASISEFLMPGTYYAIVGSQATYTGDIGRYTLRVEQPQQQSNPIINGTSGNDVIVVQHAPTNPTALQVTVNGQVVFYQEGHIDSLTVNGLAGVDTIRVEDTYGNMDLIVSGGDDYDVINIGDGNLNHVAQTSRSWTQQMTRTRSSSTRARHPRQTTSLQEMLSMPTATLER